MRCVLIVYTCIHLASINNNIDICIPNIIVIFSNCRNFIRSVEGFVSSEDKLFYILAHIRATYTTQKSEPTFTTRLSLEGTLAGTITEV